MSETKEQLTVWALFHRLWTKAVGQRGYVKREWQMMERAILLAKIKDKPVKDIFDWSDTNGQRRTNVGSENQEMKALIITPGEKVRVKEFTRETCNELLREALGNIPVDVASGPTLRAYVDDMGYYKQLPINNIASMLLGRDLVGPALIFGPPEAGEERGVPRELIEKLRSAGMIDE